MYEHGKNNKKLAQVCITYYILLDDHLSQFLLRCKLIQPVRINLKWEGSNIVEFEHITSLTTSGKSPIQSKD